MFHQRRCKGDVKFKGFLAKYYRYRTKDEAFPKADNMVVERMRGAYERVEGLRAIPGLELHGLGLRPLELRVQPIQVPTLLDQADQLTICHV